MRRGREWHTFTASTVQMLRPIVQGNEVVGAVYIESDQREIWTRASNLAQIMVVVLFGTFWLALSVGFRRERLISAPLVRLTEVTRAVTTERR